MRTFLASVQAGRARVHRLCWMAGILCNGLVISVQPLSAQSPASGSIDSSFAGWPNRRPVQFILTQSNHLFVAGFFGIQGVGTNWVRLTADGEGSPTFAPTNVGGMTALALQPDGKLLAGFHGKRDVTRFLSDGSVDSSFDFVPPFVHWRIVSFWTTALGVQSNGRILVAGYRVVWSNDDELDDRWAYRAVYRLFPNGSVDTNFGPQYVSVRVIEVLPDDRILLAGNDLQLLSPDGTRDTNFVAGGFLPTKREDFSETVFTLETAILCLAVQPDGRILVGGSFTNVQGHARSGLARLWPNGSLDLSFSPPTLISDDFAESRVSALALQADGRILVGGALQSDQWRGIRSIVRLNADGSVDRRFGHVVEAFDDDEDPLGMPSAIVIQDETRAVIGGENLDSGDLFRIHLGNLPDELRIICIQLQPASVTICWRPEGGRTYYVAHKPTLTSPDWTPVSGGIAAEGTQASWTGHRPPGDSGFYTVVRLGD